MLLTPLEHAHVEALRRARQPLGELAQVAALHLLRRRHRQGVDEGDVAGRLEVREPGQGVANDARGDLLGRRQVGRLAQDDAGEHLLAAGRVGGGGDGARRHGRVRVEDALDLERRDVLAAAPDDVLAPVDEVEVALRTALDDVAGVEPAVGPRLLGGRLVLEVAEEEVAPRVVTGGPHEQLARHADGDVGALVVDDARLDARIGPAEAVRADMARLLVRHDAGRRAGLGHRPGLEQRKAEALLEGRVMAPVDAGAEAEAQFVLAVCLERRRRQQQGRHHAEVVGDGGATVAHALPPGARMEAVELDQAATRQDRGHCRERHRVHVAERQRRDDPLLVGAHRGQAAETEIPLAGAQVVAVGESAAFRAAGRARGVEQGALAVAADGLAATRHGRRRRDAAGRLGPDGDERGLDAGGRRAQHRLALRQGDRQAHLAVPDEVGQLGRPQVGMQRHDAGAERIERQPVGEERRPVLEQQADAVAVAVAGLRVDGAQPLDLAGHLAPAARAGLDAVGGGRRRLDAEEFGVAAARGDASKGLVDSA